MLGTNQILSSKHDIAKQRSNKGTLRPPSWFFTIFLSFCAGLFGTKTGTKSVAKNGVLFQSVMLGDG